MIEANVLVHLLESIGREFIVQARRWSPTGLLGVFDGLLLPQSWALDIVRRPPPSVQRELPLQVFINSLYKMLEYLRMYELGNSSECFCYIAGLCIDPLRFSQLSTALMAP